jgi:hypothetical protein
VKITLNVKKKLSLAIKNYQENGVINKGFVLNGCFDEIIKTITLF